MDEGRKRVIDITAAILAARRLAESDSSAPRVPATIAAIHVCQWQQSRGFPPIEQNEPYLELFNVRKSLLQSDDVSPEILAIGALVLVWTRPIEFVIAAIAVTAINKTNAIHTRCEQVARRP